MDDALVLFLKLRKENKMEVLILVVMDDALVRTTRGLQACTTECLNPCCNG